MNSKTNINGIIDPKLLITTNNDDLVAIEQMKVNNSNDNQSKVPLVKDNSLNTNTNNDTNLIQSQPQTLMMSSPYGLYGGYGSYGGYGGLYNGIGGYGGYGLNYQGRGDTFFDKLFMTVERANYQMFHFCEMIKMIQNQTPTIKYFIQLLTQATYYFINKSKALYEKAKILLSLLAQIISTHPHSSSDQEQSDSLIKEIKVLDFLIKSLLITCLSGILIKLYSNN